MTAEVQHRACSQDRNPHFFAQPDTPLRRALVMAGASGSVHDLHDSAGWLATAGEVEGAEILYQTIQVIEGRPHSPSRLEHRLAVSVAHREFVQLASLLQDRTSQEVAQAHDATRPPLVTEMLSEHVATLLTFLSSDTAKPDDATRLAFGAFMSDTVPDRWASCGSLYEVAIGVARRWLGRHLRRHAPLWAGPFGSPAIFHATARLTPGALGPWLSHTTPLLSTVADLITFAGQAVTGEDPKNRVWLLVRLLAHGFDDRRLADLMAGFADRGRLDVVMRLLADRSGRSDSLALEPILTARDAAIDLGDYAYAAHMQRLRAEQAPDVANEWLILARLQATHGDIDGLRETVEHGYKVTGNTRFSELLRALRAGRPHGLKPIQAGLHSSRTTHSRRAAARLTMIPGRPAASLLSAA